MSSWVATAAPCSCCKEGGKGPREEKNREKKGVFWLFTSSYFSGERRARNVKIFRLFSSCFFGYFLLEIWNNLDCVEFFSLEKLI